MARTKSTTPAKYRWYKKIRELPDPLLNNIIQFLKNDVMLVKFMEDYRQLESSYKLLEDYSDERDMENERLQQQNARLMTRLANLGRQYDELYQYHIESVRNIRRRIDFEVISLHSDTDDNETDV